MKNALGALAAIWFSLCLGIETRAEDPAPEVVQEILEVLHERGMMSEDRYQELAGRITVYGSFAQNVGVAGLGAADGEDSAWGVGIEVGDKKKVATLGFGYFEVEANAFPAFFIDSDLLDGRSNRRGWALYGTRQISPRTDLKFELFRTNEIEDDLIFTSSIADAERFRLRLDLVVKLN